MSFSGLKTAILRQRDAMIADQGGLYEQDVADICAGFQQAVCDVLTSKSAAAFDAVGGRNLTGFAVAGGVAANGQLRQSLKDLAAKRNTDFVAPPLALCTDNAAMIAFAGLERLRLGHVDDLTLMARPRWPLDQRASAVLGSGRKGAKA